MVYYFANLPGGRSLRLEQPPLPRSVQFHQHSPSLCQNWLQPNSNYSQQHVTGEKGGLIFETLGEGGLNIRDIGSIFEILGEGGSIFETLGEGGSIFETLGEGGSIFKTLGVIMNEPKNLCVFSPSYTVTGPGLSTEIVGT